MHIFSTVKEAREAILTKKGEGKRIGFVPTMGALHKGHMALVKAAQEQCDVLVVSIFVNPAQFGPNEDLDQYPRTLDADLLMLKEAGVDMVYTPSAEVIYPDGFQTRITVSELSKHMCGASRPAFFGGIATVVTKLFMQLLPDAAFFGEKDYQQLKIIQRLVVDLDMPVTVIGVPTVREEDGLAASSRNAYLCAQERTTAAGLYAFLNEAAIKLKNNVVWDVVKSDICAKLEAEGFAIDYIELCDAESLAFVSDVSKPARLFAATTLGGTRLIDNIAV